MFKLCEGFQGILHHRFYLRVAGYAVCGCSQVLSVMLRLALIVYILSYVSDPICKAQNIIPDSCFCIVVFWMNQAFFCNSIKPVI